MVDEDVFTSQANTSWYSTGYDAMWRPMKVIDVLSQHAEAVNNVQYGPANELKQISYLNPGNGQYVTETRTYNSRLQLTEINVPGMMDMVYTYPGAGANNGKITKQKDNVSGEAINYQYDSLNRMIAAATTDASWGLSFSYDGFGNRLAQNITKGTAPPSSLQYDMNTNHITTAGFNYDANGNITSTPGPGGQSFSYDVENRLGGYSYSLDNRRVVNGGYYELYSPDGRKLASYQIATIGYQQISFYLNSTNLYFAGKLVRSRGQLAITDRLGSVGKYYPYGEDKTTTGTPTTNLALAKTATQSSTYPGYASAAAGSAVDGNTDGNFGNGSVTATNPDTNAWWQVDLGSSAIVNSIVIWNRTDCCAARLSDYWVFVSNTPFSPSDTPTTLQNRAGTWSSHQTVAPSPSVTIATGGVQGQYVRVQLSGTDYLSLAEVQVMGMGPGGPGNPPNDNVKFATYTRDAATGLDYADQRYYASGLGRFMTPDPYRATAASPSDPKTPQSWNRYMYVLGDPANYNDPMGLMTNTDGETCLWIPIGVESGLGYVWCPEGSGGGGSGPTCYLELDWQTAGPDGAFVSTPAGPIWITNPGKHNSIYVVDRYHNASRVEAHSSTEELFGGTLTPVVTHDASPTSGGLYSNTPYHTWWASNKPGSVRFTKELCDIVDSILNEGEHFTTNLPYNGLLGPNSNAFAYTLLSDTAGIKNIPSPPFFSPGWGTHLP